MYITHTIKTIDRSLLSEALRLNRRLDAGESVVAYGDNKTLGYAQGAWISLEGFHWEHVIHTLTNKKANEIVIIEYYPDRLESKESIDLSNEGC